MNHIKLLMQCHAYLRGATINTPSCNAPVDADQLARDINNYLNHTGSHAEGCWSWGPEHYMCAYEKIKRLEEKLHDLRTNTTQPQGQTPNQDQRYHAGAHDQAAS